MSNYNYFFTADEHYGHANIIKYCNRPYLNVSDMDEDMIKKFNEKVPDMNSITVHIGDFCFCKSYKEAYERYISHLNGLHVFLKGFHDNWLKGRNDIHEIWEAKIKYKFIVACHYAMRVWPKSHYNSILLYGHSHGGLPSFGKSMDVGVDTNNFYPYSSDDILSIMNGYPDNFNLVVKRRY